MAVAVCELEECSRCCGDVRQGVRLKFLLGRSHKKEEGFCWAVVVLCLLCFGSLAVAC